MSQYKIIAVSYWLSTFSEGASRILIPLYFSSIGVSATKIAVLFVTFELFGLMTTMSAGFLINRFGYRFAFVLSLILHSIASWGYLGLDYGPFWCTVLLINGLRGTRGVAKELIKTTSSAYLRHLPKRKHAANILLGGKDTTKGFGLFIGSILLTFFSFKFSFFILGILTVIMTIFSIFLIPYFKEVEQVSYRGFFSVSKNMFKLSCLRALLYSGRDLWLVVVLPVYLKQQLLSNAQVGFIMALGLVLFGIIQPLTSIFVKSKWLIGRRYLKRKWDYEYILSFTMFLVMVSPLFMIIIPHTLLGILMGVIIYNFFSGMATTPHNFLHIKFSRRQRASVDISFYKSISLLGKVIAVFFSGIIYDYFGIQGCLYMASCALFVGFWVSLSIKSDKKSNKRK